MGPANDQYGAAQPIYDALRRIPQSGSALVNGHPLDALSILLGGQTAPQAQTQAATPPIPAQSQEQERPSAMELLKMAMMGAGKGQQ